MSLADLAIFCWEFKFYIRAFDDPRLGIFYGDFTMIALVKIFSLIPTATDVKMFHSGAMLAVAVFTATKRRRKRKYDLF
jgi:hypothetical protein